LNDIADFFIEITKRRHNDRNVYTVPFRVGSVPGTNIDLVLATNTEWLFITGRNCSDHQEAGCSNGVYDHRRTESENVDWTLINTVVSRRSQLKNLSP